MPRTLFAIFFIAINLIGSHGNAQISPKSASPHGPIVTTPHVRAELLAHAPQGVAPGQPLWLGLHIEHQPEWHTYWKNPGDSGLPTELTWTLPPGLDAGEIAWPLPKKIPIGTLANYGYEGSVLLPVPVTVASTFAPGPLAKDLTIQLRATWLVCRKECIPEEGEFTLQLPIQSTTALHGAAFEAAAKAHPQPLLAGTGGIVPTSQAQLTPDGTALTVHLHGLPVALRGQPLDLFPETAEVIDNASPVRQSWNGSVWTAQIPLSAQRSASPSLLPVVVATQAAPGQDHTAGATRTGYRAELPVLGTWPAVAAAAGVSPALEAALQANAARAATTSAPGAAGAIQTPALTLVAALLGALLGGLLLNLMPCVFPVLAIKVVGFAQHAHRPRERRWAGLAYTAGVVLSFVALGALMLALRSAGEAIGWGFQLQSPAVVATLAALFTLMALNLAGVFEFSNILPSSVASLQLRHPMADSFLTGILAVAVASPCTAPFMGASMGLTATLPAAQALAVFACLGLGLALPYLAASAWPAVARALPRPGAWMQTFRRLMAFPMWATVVWLVWVLGQQSGIDGAGALLILLVGLGWLAWALSLTGRVRLWMSAVAASTLLMQIWMFGPHLAPDTPPATAAAHAASATPGQPWQPWRPGQAQALVASGQPVFVDFTAAWCVTCQYNKKTTLSNDRVLAAFAAKNVTLLRADWTRRDPDITAALAQLGRSGVPVYVLYAPGKAPVVLSEVLSVQAVEQALAGL